MKCGQIIYLIERINIIKTTAKEKKSFEEKASSFKSKLNEEEIAENKN